MNRSWSEPEAVWCRRQQRLVRLAGRMAAGGAIGTVTCVALLVFVGGRFTAIFALVLVCSLSLLGVATRQWRRERRVLALVPAHDGLVCEHCLRPLGGTETEGWRCPRCARPRDGDAARRHWLHRVRPANDDRGWRKHNRWIGLGYAWAAVWFTGMIVFNRILITSSLVAAVLESLWLLVALTGMAMFFHGRGRRVGRDLHCRECGYRIAPGSEDETCPECGLDWSDPHERQQGRTVRSPQLTTIGLVLAIGGFLMQSPRMLGASGALASATPTAALIEQVAGRWQMPGSPAWTELQARVLSPEQEARLADGLLDRREAKGHLDPASHQWLESRIATGALPTELEARYVGDAFELVGMRGPERVTVEEPFELELRLVSPPHRSSPSMWRLLRGPVTDGDGVLVHPGHEDSARPWHGYEAPYSSSANKDPEQPWGIGPLVLETPGTIELRCTLWSVYGPRPPAMKVIEWNDDGTPKLPPGVLATRTIEVVHRVEVVPGE